MFLQARDQPFMQGQTVLCVILNICNFCLSQGVANQTGMFCV